MAVETLLDFVSSLDQQVLVTLVQRIECLVPAFRLLFFFLSYYVVLKPEQLILGYVGS